MNVQVLGCSHRTAPLSFRERLSFRPEQVTAALSAIRIQFPKVEAVLLSTCNRVELYTASENGGAPTGRQAAEFLADFRGLDPGEVIQHVYDFAGRESVRHLFYVASSLDSMVVGEPQISAQVKLAYQLATQLEATGPLTHAAFQAAAKVARRVATETAIHERRVSIPGVAVAGFARRIFERFDDKRTLVIGAGEMAEETLKYLRDQGVRDISIINRSPDRARDLASRCQGRCCLWCDLFDELGAADMVVSTTGATQPIVTRETFERVHSQRSGRPLFILDLAVPRDFEPEIGQWPGVYLYSVDDLKAECDRNRVLRERELPAALRIVEKETDRFMSDLHFRVTGPVVRQLKEMGQRVGGNELQRLLNKLPDLDAQQRDEIRNSFDRLINKLLHPPLESLRVESRSGMPNSLLESVRRLFQFKD
jgi:glutamyl-tRNA reductase